MDRGDVPAARELYAQALAAFKAIGNEAATATVLGNLAMLEFAEGHPELALQAASQALEIHARGKNAIHLAVDYANLAGYQIALGDLSAARDSAREGLRLARASTSMNHSSPLRCSFLRSWPCWAATHAAVRACAATWTHNTPRWKCNATH